MSLLERVCHSDDFCQAYVTDQEQQSHFYPELKLKQKTALV